MNELALFAGAGGGILGGHLLGWRTVCAVEWEQYPASVLCARQNDGLLPPFPIWDDVQTFDGKPWREIVDVVSGGFPCTDISAAGKGAGIDGEASGMWREMARIIHEVRPKFVFVENSPMLTSRGLGRVLGDLASMGFNARWGVLGAADVGANHQRDRIWIVAKRPEHLPHAQHDRIGRWEQQQKSIKKEIIANTRCKSERPNERLQPTSQISIGEDASIVCGKVSNSTIHGLHNEENKCILESQGRNKLQSQQSRDTSDVANTSELFSYGGNDNGRISMERESQSESGNNSGPQNMANTSSLGQQRQRQHEQSINSKTSSNWQTNIIEPISTSDFWAIEPNVGRVVNGVASRVDRLKAIGNGQVPLCAATAWRILSESL